MKLNKLAACLFAAALTLSNTFISAYAEDTEETVDNTTYTYNGHTYQVFDISETWEEAKEYCETLGGHLVTITSEEENLFIENLIDKFSKYHYHIGLTDDGRGNYNWVTGENFKYNKSISSADGQRDQYTYVITSINMEEPFIHVWGDHDTILRGDAWDYTNSGFICEWGIDTDEPADSETPTDYLPGDANCDGNVTISDAVAILQYLANSEKFPLDEQGLKNADVDGIAGVTGKDAAVIQLYDAKAVTELPIK